MLAIDFEYDGVRLSNFGFTICEFDSSSGVEEISIGSTITFNTVSRHYGKTYGLASTQYDECIEATFSACKNPDDYDAVEITSEEMQEIARWLNRRQFLRTQFIYDDEDMIERQDIHYYASFNISKVTVAGKIYGFTATMTTNSPFGYGDEIIKTIDITDTDSTYKITDESSEIGYIYPSLTITCNSDGDLDLINETVPCDMQILNCVSDEVITINGDTLIISSSADSHALYNDFNFDFFKIGNTYENRENVISASIPCTLVLKYTPIFKDSPD